MKLRLAVKQFAEAMEEILRQNDHKGKVTEVPLSEALSRIWDEVRELDRAAFGHINMATTRVDRKAIRKEAVDVANFALMVWFAARD